jgi:hypothetical protein
MHERTHIYIYIYIYIYIHTHIRLLTDNSNAGSSSSRRQRASVPTHHTLPNNLESLTLAELKSVAAAHGIDAKGNTKRDVLDSIERERFRDEPQMRLTRTAENDDEEENVQRKRKRKQKTLDDDDDDDDDADEVRKQMLLLCHALGNGDVILLLERGVLHEYDCIVLLYTAWSRSLKTYTCVQYDRVHRRRSLPGCLQRAQRGHWTKTSKMMM